MNPGDCVGAEVAPPKAKADDSYRRHSPAQEHSWRGFLLLGLLARLARIISDAMRSTSRSPNSPLLGFTSQPTYLLGAFAA